MRPHVCCTNVHTCVLSSVRLFVIPRTVCSLLGASLHGIFPARILEWVAISFSRGLRHPGIESASRASPPLAGGFLTISATSPVLTMP